MRLMALFGAELPHVLVAPCTVSQSAPLPGVPLAPFSSSFHQTSAGSAGLDSVMRP
jgi:hypothetical protein